MKNLLILSVLAATFLACSRKPIQSSGSLPPRDLGVGPAVIEKRTILGEESQLSDTEREKLRQWNSEAGYPTFGLIGAFYQLPASNPLKESPRPFGIIPASDMESEVFSRFYNTMLDAGVRMSEVSMADANQIVEAEKTNFSNSNSFWLSRVLPSGVSNLISIQKGQGREGPLFIGRVIQSRDGRILAMGTQYNSGPEALEPLLNRLLKDSLKRLATEPKL